jgi:acetyl esterase/lipase
MALLLYLRDHKMSLPGGAILLSPWVDQTASLGSWDSNAVRRPCFLRTHSPSRLTQTDPTPFAPSTSTT